MITKTYFNKCNTIIKDSYVNSGINPVAELNYGKDLTRIIFQFDTEKIEKLVCDKTYADISKLKHKLVMTNCASLDNTILDKKMLSSTYQGFKERAVSFDIIFFLIPKQWDGGRGFDYVNDLALRGTNNALSTEASNWYNAKSGVKWETEGIYSIDKLSLEYDKFSSTYGNQSEIIIGRYHFDYGNESIEFDITDTVNKFITHEIENYGIGIAFTPMLENSKTTYSQYVGFFTPFTNTFYEPYVETSYEEVICDDRNDFYLDKLNRIYFYSNIGGNPTNLDELPICEVNGSQIVSKQATKGVYYVELLLSSEDYDENTMIYDTWTNLKYKGKKLKDVELDFVTKSEDDYFQFDDTETLPKIYVPSIKGIQYNEKIRRGDIRKVIVEARVPYTTNELEIIDGMSYRLYVMDGVRELDVIKYEAINKTPNYNYFLINTNDLLPNRYYLDVKMESNLEVKHFRKILSFDIVNDITEKYV